MVEVTIDNVLQTSPVDLGIWLATRILNIRLPSPWVNSTLDTFKEINPVIVMIANNLALCTQLYVMVIGAKGVCKVSSVDNKTDKITILTAQIDQLYRGIQTLQEMLQSARTMMSAAKQFQHLGF